MIEIYFRTNEGKWVKNPRLMNYLKNGKVKNNENIPIKKRFTFK